MLLSREKNYSNNLNNEMFVLEYKELDLPSSVEFEYRTNRF